MNESEPYTQTKAQYMYLFTKIAPFLDFRLWGLGLFPNRYTKNIDYLSSIKYFFGHSKYVHVIGVGKILQSSNSKSSCLDPDYFHWEYLEMNFEITQK